MVSLIYSAAAKMSTPVCIGGSVQLRAQWCVRWWLHIRSAGITDGMNPSCRLTINANPVLQRKHRTAVDNSTTSYDTAWNKNVLSRHGHRKPRPVCKFIPCIQIDVETKQDLPSSHHSMGTWHTMLAKMGTVWT